VRIKSDLAKIEKAFQKIEDGTYGFDEAGKQISEERLKVLPWADKAI
jgi:RNA polymerase-binding transcription factor DksA